MGRNKDTHSLQQATGDLARLLSGELSNSDVNHIGLWPQRDHAYQKHFVETSHLLDDLDVLREDSIVDKWVAEIEAESGEQKQKKRQAIGWSLSAAAALLLATVAVFFTMPAKEAAIDNTYRYVTRVGEQKRINLPDGTVVNINTNSQLLVNYSAEARNLQLLNGEVYFTVAKDAERPFRVTSGDHVVTVLGTQFNLREWPGKLELSVAEGTVALSKVGGKAVIQSVPLSVSDGGSIRLGSNDVYRINAGTVVKIDQADGQLLAHIDSGLSQKLSWRSGILRFESESLSSVVAELNRYSAKSIVIMDPEISDLVIYSTFGVDRINQALLGIENSLPVKIEQTFDRIEIYEK